MSKWRFYFPDDGETANDAVAFPSSWVSYTFADIAQYACEEDFNHRSGWERPDYQEFAIAVISPLGVERRFVGRHQPSVDHVVRDA